MRQKMRSRTLFGSLVTVGFFAACGGSLPEAPQATTTTTVTPQKSAVALPAGEQAPSLELQAAFARASAEFGVPEELLIAIAKTETNFYFVPGVSGDAFEGQAAYGVMALRGERLARGAELAQVSIAAVQTEVLANVRAAAALLRSQADALGLRSADLAGWAQAVANFSGVPSGDAAAEYVDRGVYATLRSGLPDEVARLHGLSLRAHSELPTQLLSPATPSKWNSAYWTGAKWKPAPDSNFTNGRSAKVELLVIHTCAGAYSGCWGWLVTPYPTNPNKTSAHYVVKEDGSEVVALVDETDTAHHVGKPWKGLPTNSRSIGIEHGGFPFQGTNVWLSGQIDTSIKLSCDIVKRNTGIIQDRDHIIGHYQPDPVNRADDPGTNFPWADFMTRINTCVGGAPPPPPGIIVDTNQANNGANARFNTPSSSWVSSKNVAGYWGTGYYAAPTASVADSADFEFQLAAGATKEVFAWWTAASDRATSTPFVIFDASGAKLATVNKNQQNDGGKWVSLGKYAFTAGWNKVSVSRWTTPGAQVIADAIRVE